MEIRRDNLLAFTLQLDRDQENLAQDWHIIVSTAREVLDLQYLSTWALKR